ncbi:MAG: site-2 protease family protein [Candidatus Thorarchaeota archaeon]
MSEEFNKETNIKPEKKEHSKNLPTNEDISSLNLQCWNCGTILKNPKWCDKCRAPIDEEIKSSILKRTTISDSIKCWRCGGTTSGDICGICGSPLSVKGLELVADQVVKTVKTDIEKEPEYVLILSPRDRQLVKIDLKYSELEELITKHFTLIKSGLTNYGPEIVVKQPDSKNTYDDFENEYVLVNNNLRTIYRKSSSEEAEEKFVTLRFFYWQPEDISQRFSFKNMRWKLLFLAMTLTTVIITGWLYTKEVYEIFSLSTGMALDIFLFTISILGIIIAHEVGHFIIQRIKKLNLSLPFFVPIPPIPGFMSYFMLGTAGGFLRVVDPVRKRNDLFDLYFMGSIFGLVISMILLLIGMTSPYIEDMVNLTPVALERYNDFNLYNPKMLITYFFDWFVVVTRILPEFDATTQVMFLHPVAYAGIVGLILNGLNFLPGSILDGGFMFRSLFGERLTRTFSFLTALALMFNYNTWALGVLTMFIPLNIYQSPITNEAIPAHWSKYLLEVLSLGIAVICFPIPAFIL